MISEETREKMRIARLGKPSYWSGKRMSEETRTKMSLAHMGERNNFYGKHHIEDSRAKISKSLSGVNHPNFGKHHSTETKRKISEANKGENAVWYGKTMPPEVREKMSLAHKGEKSYWYGKHLSDEAREKLRIANLGKKASKETKAKMSRVHKLENLNLEFKNRRVKAIMKAMHESPNKFETTVGNLLDELYPNEWKYTGNGDVMIGGLTPDFFCVNGQKKIVECFGTYWHSARVRKWQDTEQGKKALYRSYGYDTLVIWENELKDLDTLTEKVRVFCCHKEA